MVNSSCMENLRSTPYTSKPISSDGNSYTVDTAKSDRTATLFSDKYRNNRAALQLLHLNHMRVATLTLH